MSNKIYFENKVAYDWIRYKDGYWIPHRKRVYLYWFKYLQEAEQCPEFAVETIGRAWLRLLINPMGGVERESFRKSIE